MCMFLLPFFYHFHIVPKHLVTIQNSVFKLNGSSRCDRRRVGWFEEVGAVGLRGRGSLSPTTQLDSRNDSDSQLKNLEVLLMWSHDGCML